MSSEKKNQDIKISIKVKKSPTEVFDAIRDVAAWWVGDVSGNADEVGSTFTYRYKEFHDSTQVLTELIPNKKVAWHVSQSTLSFTKDKNEWTGTDLIFEILPAGDQTEVIFTHKGLNPDKECFEACSGGWDFYITKSLNNLILNGEGMDPGF